MEKEYLKKHGNDSNGAESPAQLRIKIGLMNCNPTNRRSNQNYLYTKYIKGITYRPPN